jgi:hypothetical protein
MRDEVVEITMLRHGPNLFGVDNTNRWTILADLTRSHINALNELQRTYLGGISSGVLPQYC